MSVAGGLYGFIHVRTRFFRVPLQIKAIPYAILIGLEWRDILELLGPDRRPPLTCTELWYITG